MGAWYLDIDPIQEPFDSGLDEQGRETITFNINVVKASSDTFTEELAKILTDANVGILGANIFISSKVTLPPVEENDGPYLSIIETGGTNPDRTHNVISPPAYARPSAQVVCRDVKYTVARALARAAYNALAAVRNQTVTP